jgi:uncharacterized phage-associated protein
MALKAPEPRKPEPIRFRFDERRAAAAASFLLELAGGSLEYLALIKLLYFADRESLDVRGRPISGDRFVSMRNGPVLSTVYELVRLTIAGQQTRGPWAERIESDGRYRVRLRGRPDVSPLSEAELAILRQVFEQSRKDSRWTLRDKSHQLPEWEDPGESSREIRIETVLQVLGKTADEIEEVREAAREAAHFKTLFGR